MTGYHWVLVLTTVAAAVGLVLVVGLIHDNIECRDRVARLEFQRDYARSWIDKDGVSQYTTYPLKTSDPKDPGPPIFRGRSGP